MNRKEFLRNVTTIAAFSAVGTLFPKPLKSIVDENFKNSKGLLIPRKLKLGDRVGLVAPGGVVSETELKEAIDNIKSIGLVPVVGKNVLKRKGYLAGNDSERAEDINAMFSDDSINAVWAVRGGYGCARILDLIDYNAIEKGRKVFIGYSDTTALSLAIYAKTGLVSFHGPVGISTFDEFSKKSLQTVLFTTQESIQLSNYAERKKDVDSEPFVVKEGITEGRLLGGNLSLITSLIGTKYEPDYNGAILFIEETNEEPYRIDRMFTQMIQSGKLNGVKGIAFGIFNKCNPKPDESGMTNSPLVKDVLIDLTKNLNIPVAYGFSFGHIKYKFTIPYGVKARLNAGKFELSVLEKSVQ